MYVRWQTYRTQARDPRHRARNNKHARLKAVLVESVRVGGKPRQMHIAFLGSMSIDRSDMHRFWREVTARLDQLGNRVGPENRDRLLASIAEKVGEGPPTPAELEQYAREYDALGIKPACRLAHSASRPARSISRSHVRTIRDDG